MSNTTPQEDKVLEAAAELLRVSRGPVRFLDVLSKAVAAYTHDERIRKAWETFEREANRLGFQDDPHLYCATCKGEGDVMRTPPAGAPYLDACMACEGHGFLGYASARVAS